MIGVKSKIWQYFGSKPNTNREPDNINEGKEVEVNSLLPVALHHLTAPCSITPINCIKLLPTILQIIYCLENDHCFVEAF